jgi:hypothetical protein
MSAHLITTVAASFFLVVLLTTLLLPGRQTPAVIKQFFAGASGLTRASLGK